MGYVVVSRGWVYGVALTWASHHTLDHLLREVRASIAEADLTRGTIRGAGALRRDLRSEHAVASVAADHVTGAVQVGCAGEATHPSLAGEICIAVRIGSTLVDGAGVCSTSAGRAGFAFAAFIVVSTGQQAGRVDAERPFAAIFVEDASI